MQKHVKTTGYVSGVVQAKVGLCYLTAVQINTDGSNNATVTVYDNITNSGKILFKMTIAGTAYLGGRDWNIPMLAEIGLCAELTGTGAEMAIEYMEDLVW